MDSLLIKDAIETCFHVTLILTSIEFLLKLLNLFHHCNIVLLLLDLFCKLLVNFIIAHGLFKASSLVYHIPS